MSLEAVVEVSHRRLLNMFFKFIRLVFYAPHFHVSQKAGRESKEVAAFVKLIVAPGDGGEAIVVSWI